MIKPALAFGALSSTLALTLGGCFGPGEPVVLSDNDVEAASACFAAKGIQLREGKAEGEAITYAEFTDSIAYALVASARTEPFSTDTVGTVIDGSGAVIDDIAMQDYAGAIPACDERFGMDGSVTLPDDDADAILSCLALAAFLQGAAQAQVSEFGDDGAAVGPLFDRLSAKLESDPDVLVKLIADTEGAAMNDATQTAFAEGNPREYVNQCDARFPAGG